jgi:hypothetical protein
MLWKIKKKLNVKIRKETGKDRRTWRDLAQKAKTHKTVAVPTYDNDYCDDDV